jgi:hypothetical protein
MLPVCGFALQNAYATQFDKIMTVIIQDYFPKIREASVTVSGGSLSRFEDFLQQYVHKWRGAIPPPEEVLTISFWLS